MEAVTVQQPQTPSKMKKFLPIGIGIVLSIIILILGFGMVQNLFTKAADARPQDVIISDISQNSAKVTWTTGQETQGVVEYGTSPTTLSFNVPETDKTTSHSVEMTLLSPNTTYYFQIKVKDEKFDNGGIPWQFTTKSTQEAQPSISPIPSPTVPVVSPSAAPTSSSASCNETNCESMKAKFGKGCTTQDYFKCVKKLTPTP